MRKVIVLTSCLPEKIDTAMKNTLTVSQIYEYCYSASSISVFLAAAEGATCPCFLISKASFYFLNRMLQISVFQWSLCCLIKAQVISATYRRISIASQEVQLILIIAHFRLFSQVKYSHAFQVCVASKRVSLCFIGEYQHNCVLG